MIFLYIAQWRLPTYWIRWCIRHQRGVACFPAWMPLSCSCLFWIHWDNKRSRVWRLSSCPVGRRLSEPDGFWVDGIVSGNVASDGPIADAASRQTEYGEVVRQFEYIFGITYVSDLLLSYRQTQSMAAVRSGRFFMACLACAISIVRPSIWMICKSGKCSAISFSTYFIWLRPA